MVFQWEVSRRLLMMTMALTICFTLARYFLSKFCISLFLFSYQPSGLQLQQPQLPHDWDGGVNEAFEVGFSIFHSCLLYLYDILAAAASLLHRFY